MIKLLIGCVFLFAMQNANAQDSFKELFEKHWTGYLKGRYEGFENPDYYMKMEVNSLNYDEASGTFTCFIKTNISIDYVSYSCTDYMTGSFNPEDQKIYFNFEYNSSADKLPNEMYWIHDDMSATVYANETHPGYYLMQGTAGSSTFEFGDYSE